MVSVKQAPTRYFFELGFALLLYAGAMALRGYALHHPIAIALFKDVFLVSPIVALLIGALAAYRFYRRMDELMRQRLLTSLAASAAVTALFSMSYGFLRVFGFPPLPLGSAFSVIAATWILYTLFYSLRDAVVDPDTTRTQKYFPLIGFVGAAIFFLIGVSARLTGSIAPNPLYPLTALGLVVAVFGYQQLARRRDK